MSSKTPASWAEAAASNKWNQEPELQSSIQEIKTLLEGNKSPSDVAQSLTATWEPTVRETHGPTCGSIFNLWGLLCEPIREFGGDAQQAERLADLFISFKALPDLKDERGEPIQNFDRSVYWKDLPGFGLAFGDFGVPEGDTGIPGDDSEDEGGPLLEPLSSDWYINARPMLNATTFAATWAHRAGLDAADVTPFAKSALYSAFEGRDRPNVAVFPGEMVVAATWLIIAGEQIRRKCQSNTDPGPEEVDKKRGWYSLGWFFPARWKLWKQSLEDFANMSDMDERAVVFAEKAYAKMDELDQKQSSE